MQTVSTTPELERWMVEAIAEAQAAQAMDEVPIGCIIFRDATGEIVGRGHNRRVVDSDPTAHAEIVAIRQAAKLLGDWRLIDCTLVVTLEPCPMCAGAMLNARIPRLVYGCADPKAGAVRSLFTLCEDARLNHRLEVVAGVMAEACGELLRAFFRSQRARGKK